MKQPKRLGYICLIMATLFGACTGTKPVAKPPVAAAVGNAKAQSDKSNPLKQPLAPYQPSATRLHDLLHTRLQVHFDWQKQYMPATATLTLKPYFYPQKELVLDAKGFDIREINLLKPHQVKLQYTYDQRYLRITLDKEYTRNENYTLEIQYTAKPNELANTTKSLNAPISQEKGLYFINPLGTESVKPQQIWTQGETEGSSAWFPTLDHPNERMTQEVYITVDKKYVTLSNGSLIYSKENADGTRTDYWKQDKGHAPYLAMMAIGDFAIIQDKWRGLPVTYYVEPKYRNTARKTFGHTPEMMEFFSKKLGVDFAWDKYAQVVVRDYVSGAMENTSATVMMEAVQQDERELLDRNWDDIIAHELFHQWFGDLVTCESWANLTLNESFADYSEYLWAEYKYGPYAAAHVQQEGLSSYLGEATFKQVPLVRYHHQAPDDMFDSHSYAKGGRVLHMLRNLVGDQAFFSSLKLYLTRHQFAAAEIADLRQAFEEVTGQDLMWFFNQWYLAPGHPVLSVSHKYQAGEVQLTVKQEQDTTLVPVYRLPVKVTLYNEGKTQTVPIEITKASQTFTFKSATAPALVLFDADHQLLAEIKHDKTQAELLYQLQNSKHLQPRTEAIKLLAKELQDDKTRQAMLTAVQDTSYLIRNEAALAFTGYDGPGKEQVVNKLKQMALTDKKRPSRALAIEVLSSLPDADFSALYTNSLADSSYNVISTAIQALAAGKQPATELVTALEGLQNNQVTGAIAAYYAEKAVPGKATWFEQQITNTKGGALYSLLQDYGKYLLKQDAATQQKAVPILKDLASTNSVFYIRLAAYQALSMLTETPELKTIKQQIRENEKDPRLQKIFTTIQ